MRSQFLPAMTSFIMPTETKATKNNTRTAVREGISVIELDLAHLSREELERVITERCSRFGSVIAVVIVQDSAHYNFALASVEMSTRDEALELLRHLGDSLVDDVVVIRIEQRSGKR